MLVSLIVPCYNEESALDAFYAEICKVMNEIENYDFELIFVDDGSYDNTLGKIKAFRENDKRVRYISFSRNFGKESAMYAGFEHAKGDYITIMDADLQDPPSLIKEMLTCLESGYDSAAARRVSRKGEPVIRSFFARSFYKLINRNSKFEIADGARDFRMMNKKMKNAVLSLSEYHRFSKGIFGWVGFKTKWIEYENIERVSGETKWSFGALVKYAIEGLVAFTTMPLRIASVLGIIISAFAFIYMIFIVLRTIILGIDIAGYASLLSFILFIGGMTLTSIGILGEYLAKTYIEVKNRPKYISAETSEDEDK